MTYNSIITYSLGEVKKRSSMIIKNREKCFGLFFSGGKNELCISFISRNWKLFFWCCNTCCISCSIRHQSVHFFRKMSIVSHLMTFSVKYRVIHMEKWPIFKIFLIKSNCCLPFHLWILFTNVSTYYKTSKNLKCQSESNTFAKKFFLSQFWSIYFSVF